MAEDEAKPVKKTKKAVPEAPPESKEAKTLPTPPAIRSARKADLVKWCEELQLDTTGKVDDLRQRLLEYVEKEGKPAAEGKAPEEKGKPAARTEAAEEPGKEEREEYEPKLKPALDEATKRLLALRRLKAAQRPKFRRQEWFRYRKFGDEWRKPQGGQSKLRRHFGYRWNLPSIGYRGPRRVRGLHPSGFEEVLVHNPNQLEGLDPAKQAVRIAHGVGTRKRELIEKACEEKGLRVLNRMVTE
ncbi:MAG TPA: 50S ribosomal protein L32e [Thermoplasmata archaeon]|jgi:large subunit ribosomal protein L32e